MIIDYNLDEYVIVREPISLFPRRTHDVEYDLTGFKSWLSHKKVTKVFESGPDRLYDTKQVDVDLDILSKTEIEEYIYEYLREVKVNRLKKKYETTR